MTDRGSMRDCGLVILLLQGVFCCVFHGNRLYSGGGEGCVRGWDLSSGQQVLTLDGNNEEVVRVLTSPTFPTSSTPPFLLLHQYCLQVNDRYIVSGSGYSVVRVWSQSGLLLHTLRGHMGVVRCLHLDGNRLVSGGDRKAIIVWDLAVRALLNCLNPWLVHPYMYIEGRGSCLPDNHLI